MGQSQTLIVKERDRSQYCDKDHLVSFSSEKYENILRLYRIISTGRNGRQNGKGMEIYEVILFNRERENRCFILFQTYSLVEGEKRFQELSEVLTPFIDIFPSIFSCNMLASLIKVRMLYPSWSMHKVAKYLQLPEIVDWKSEQQQQETLELIKKQEPSFFSELFGTTPLQYLTEVHPELIESCMSPIYSLQQAGKDWKESLESIMKFTESPIHVAIRLSQESVLKMLLEKGANPSIPCGHAYPIHLAMQYETLGCAKLLLQYDANCLKVRDKKYGGTALHWVKSSDFINFLVEQQMDLDARNCDNETPLHIMIMRKRLASVITLICHGADINAKGKNGATPLHYAVKQGDLDIVRALLIFSADRSLKDDNGKVSLECLDEDSLCGSDMSDIFALFEYDHKEKQFPGIRTQSIMKERTGHECILTLDGGGIRGLILTEILMALEFVSNHTIYELFDWISGTSTGAYLAVSIANGKSVRHCQRTYFHMVKEAFRGKRPYLSEKMDNFLRSEFGDETKMDSIKYPSIMIPAVMGDRRPAMLHLFRNYDAPYDEHYQMRDARFPRPSLPSDQLIWLATRSSCSAPSYFRSTGRYLDGGLIANNPTLDVLSEIHKYEKFHGAVKEKKSSIKVVVSVGTGRQPLKVLPTIDLYRPSSLWDTRDIMDNLRGFIDLMIDQVAASDDHVVDRARSWCEMIDIDYYRFNPVLSTDVELDETDNRILLSMLCDVRKYIHKKLDIMRKLSTILLGEVSAPTG